MKYQMTKHHRISLPPHPSHLAKPSRFYTTPYKPQALGMPHCPSPQPSDTLCFLGVGADQQQQVETHLRSLFHAATAVDVQATKTFVCFASQQIAEGVRQQWQGQVLPLGLSQHPVKIMFGRYYAAKTNPEPEDVRADPITGGPCPDAALPPGLKILPFLTVAEETALLALVDGAEWDTSQVFRRTQHYGAAAIDFKTRNLGQTAPMAPIPPMCRDLLAHAREQQEALGVLWSSGPLAEEELPCLERDQMTVNEYLPGAGIANHIDVHSLFEDGFLVLSLGSAYVMDFKKEKQKQESDGGEKEGEEGEEARFSLLLPQRSLLVLQGDARYGWSHGLASRKTDKINGQLVARGRRVSLSFRRVQKGSPPVCDCAFPEACDSRSGDRFVGGSSSS